MSLKEEGTRDRQIEKMYRDDLKAKKKELENITEELNATRARRGNAKDAVLEYEKFVKLF